MIATWTLAIGQKLDIRGFAGLIVPYPPLERWENAPP